MFFSLNLIIAVKKFVFAWQKRGVWPYYDIPDSKLFLILMILLWVSKVVFIVGETGTEHKRKKNSTRISVEYKRQTTTIRAAFFAKHRTRML